MRHVEDEDACHLLYRSRQPAYCHSLAETMAMALFAVTKYASEFGGGGTFLSLMDPKPVNCIASCPLRFLEQWELPQNFKFPGFPVHYLEYP
jgi:hypothetical protein